MSQGKQSQHTRSEFKPTDSFSAAIIQDQFPEKTRQSQPSLVCSPDVAPQENPLTNSNVNNTSQHSPKSFSSDSEYQGRGNFGHLPLMNQHLYASSSIQRPRNGDDESVKTPTLSCHKNTLKRNSHLHLFASQEGKRRLFDESKKFDSINVVANLIQTKTLQQIGDQGAVALSNDKIDTNSFKLLQEEKRVEGSSIKDTPNEQNITTSLIRQRGVSNFTRIGGKSRKNLVSMVNHSNSPAFLQIITRNLGANPNGLAQNLPNPKHQLLFQTRKVSQDDHQKNDKETKMLLPQKNLLAVQNNKNTSLHRNQTSCFKGFKLLDMSEDGGRLNASASIALPQSYRPSMSSNFSEKESNSNHMNQFYAGMASLRQSIESSGNDNRDAAEGRRDNTSSDLQENNKKFSQNLIINSATNYNRQPQRVNLNHDLGSNKNGEYNEQKITLPKEIVKSNIHHHRVTAIDGEESSEYLRHSNSDNLGPSMNEYSRIAAEGSQNSKGIQLKRNQEESVDCQKSQTKIDQKDASNDQKSKHSDLQTNKDKNIERMHSGSANIGAQSQHIKNQIWNHQKSWSCRKDRIQANNQMQNFHRTKIPLYPLRDDSRREDLSRESNGSKCKSRVRQRRRSRSRSRSRSSSNQSMHGRLSNTKKSDRRRQSSQYRVQNSINRSKRSHCTSHRLLDNDKRRRHDHYQYYNEENRVVVRRSGQKESREMVHSCRRQMTMTHNIIRCGDIKNTTHTPSRHHRYTHGSYRCNERHASQATRYKVPCHQSNDHPSSFHTNQNNSYQKHEYYRHNYNQNGHHRNSPSRHYHYCQHHDNPQPTAQYPQTETKAFSVRNGYEGRGSSRKMIIEDRERRNQRRSSHRRKGLYEENKGYGKDYNDSHRVDYCYQSNRSSRKQQPHYKNRWGYRERSRSRNQSYSSSSFSAVSSSRLGGSRRQNDSTQRSRIEKQFDDTRFFMPKKVAASPHSSVDRSKDAGHFEWHQNMILTDGTQNPYSHRPAPNQYRVVSHLGDGTFGRVLLGQLISDVSQQTSNPESLQMHNKNSLQKENLFAIKVIRAVPRYLESAEFEARILDDLKRKGGCQRGIVYLKEQFVNKSKQSYQRSSGLTSNKCLVFEPLGKSLFDFIKDNNYKGFEIGQVRDIAIKALKAVEFLHSLKLTHTDLKPENILLKHNTFESITNEAFFPIQVKNKRQIFGSQRCSEMFESSSKFSGSQITHSTSNAFNKQQIQQTYQQPTASKQTQQSFLPYSQFKTPQSNTHTHTHTNHNNMYSQQQAPSSATSAIIAPSNLQWDQQRQLPPIASISQKQSLQNNQQFPFQNNVVGETQRRTSFNQTMTTGISPFQLPMKPILQQQFSQTLKNSASKTVQNGQSLVHPVPSSSTTQIYASPAIQKGAQIQTLKGLVHSTSNGSLLKNQPNSNANNVSDSNLPPIQSSNSLQQKVSQQPAGISQRPPPQRVWKRPLNTDIRLIDFGGATYEEERHTLIINTRQYRAPEVILENRLWNEKSDIWSMACILVELYTGELFFDPSDEDNLEHLAMIEKQCGPIPLWMAQKCGNKTIGAQLHKNGDKEEELYVRTKLMRLRWPAAAQRSSTRHNVEFFNTLDKLIDDRWGQQHSLFKDFLKFMLKIDPKQRPSATETLQHPFLREEDKLVGLASALENQRQKLSTEDCNGIKISKSTEKTRMSTDHRFESPLSPSDNTRNLLSRPPTQLQVVSQQSLSATCQGIENLKSSCQISDNKRDEL